MIEGSLFTGAGGGLYGSRMLGWRTAFCAERDEYCQRVLRARMRDGWIEECPIYDDVSHVTGEWRGKIDVLSAGFPCQPYSMAGRQLGAADPRDVWDHTARIIRDLEPPFVWLENVPGLLNVHRWGDILGELASAGYDAAWRVLGAGSVGAPHRRDRLWVLAWQPDGARRFADPYRQSLRTQQKRERGRSGEAVAGHDGSARAVANPYCQRQLQSQRSLADQRRWARDPGWWTAEPPVGRVAHRVADRDHHGLRALGNGQVPQSMVVAFCSLWRIMLRDVLAP